MSICTWIYLWALYFVPLICISVWLHLELKLFSSCVSDTSSCLFCFVLTAALGREILCHHLLWPLLSLLFLPTTLSASSGSQYYKHGAVWLGRCWDLGFSLIAYFVDSLKPFAPHHPWVSHLKFLQLLTGPSASMQLRGYTSASCTHKSLGQNPIYPTSDSSILTSSSPKQSLLHP